MTFISVIIPTFNRASVLQRALNSIYAQTYPADEVIVVDDGSTDDTEQMIATYFPQVIYSYQTNQGVSAARNTGINQAKGNWLAFLDSDDEWLPTKLFQQVNSLKNTDYHVCHTEEIWIRNGVRVNQMKKHKKIGGWIFKECLPLCAMSPSSIMIHRHVFNEVGLFDLSFPACEDYDLWLKITEKYPVLLIESPQIKKYGGHDDQLSQQYWGMDRFRIQALENCINRGKLSLEDRGYAIEMLLKKATIFQKGTLKRGKKDAFEYYQRLINSFEKPDKR
ncbi:MAG: glycosyltransferase family A protein [Methylococcales bacterium]|nr:glycosyltransferase family A protein [Methylococcales bacterium]